jgi:hypothetical protein
VTHYLAKPKIFAVCCTLTLEETLFHVIKKKSKDLMEVGMIGKKVDAEIFL